MSIEARLKRLEIIEQRIARKLPRKLSVMSVPYPVSIFCAEAIDGIAIRYMFPAAGTITKVCMLIENAERATPVETKLISLNGSYLAKSFNIRKSGEVFDLSIPVEPSDRLEISVPPGTLGIWCAFLWKPKLSDHALKRFALEELENFTKEFKLEEPKLEE